MSTQPELTSAKDVCAIGARLREERKRLCLTQMQVAVAAGISCPTQVGYEAGRRVPDLHYLTAIEQLGVDERYVRTGVRSSRHAVHLLNWEHYNDVFVLVTAWLRDAEIEIEAKETIEVARLVYELSLEDASNTKAVAERLLRLVVSRQ